MTTKVCRIEATFAFCGRARMGSEKTLHAISPHLPRPKPTKAIVACVSDTCIKKNFSFFLNVEDPSQREEALLP